MISYEAAFTDRPPPGRHIILRLEKDGRETEVVSIPTLVEREGSLICEFEALDPALDTAAVEALIRHELLAVFCDGYYDSRVRQLQIVDLRTGSRSNFAYGH